MATINLLITIAGGCVVIGAFIIGISLLIAQGSRRRIEKKFNQGDKDGTSKL